MRVFLVLIFLLPSICFSQKYLGQDPPGTTPEIFAPGVISKSDRYEFGSVFSLDKTTCYIGVDHGEGEIDIQVSRFVDGEWTETQALLPDFPYSNNDPMLNPDETKLFFISNAPVEGTGEVKNINIWYVEKERNGWSKPQPLSGSGPINSQGNEYYICFDAKGNMYYASNIESLETASYNYDIYRATPDFSKTERLPNTINTERYEADVYVAPDQSYMIFCSIRRDGMGNGDLYISFNEEGKWTEAINMGDPINTEGHELCPFVTQDGKYLFYTSNQDIFWVSTDILKKYKNN